MAQDGLLELIERRPWLDAELLDKRAARCLERLERIGLPAAAVEGQHELDAQTLPQRMLRDQRLELRDEVAVAAEREVGIDSLLERQEAKLVQPADRRLGEPLIRKLRERRAAPESECVAERICGRRRIRIGGAGDEGLEAMQIQLVRVRRARRSPAAQWPGAQSRHRAPCGAARRSPGAPRIPIPDPRATRARRRACQTRQPRLHGAGAALAGCAASGPGVAPGARLRVPPMVRES